MEKRYAGYPSVFVFDIPGGKKKVQHLLWGDWMSVTGRDGDWLKIHSRGCDGWVREKDVQKNQLLEVNFVDIGQGDGSFIVTPDDKFILIDAGEGDNMFRFLRWRFGLKQNPSRKITFDTAIMSHPDSDHYKGFEPLFDSKQFEFDNLYHNGILEQTGDDVAGLGSLDASGKYLLSIYPDRAAVEAHVKNEKVVGKGALARVMRKALDCAKDVRMLSVRDQWVPGYGEDAPVSMQVLAPIPEDVGGATAYRLFGRRGQQKGPTKNGHSVVIKLRIGKITMLLGGDLNIPAEDYLLDHYAGDRASPDFLDRARSVFRADVAKACHHGSADLSIDYLKAVDSLATIVSSGDDEPHCHPRPDALGAFGRHGRGERPLIFSTELARSAPEKIKDPAAIRTRVSQLVALLNAAKDDEQRTKLAADIDAAVDLDRSVAVYGMINVRTDGDRVIIAQKLEQPRSFTGEKWDIHKLIPGKDGLEYDSKH
jgi:beta-lactamase superfamily II metal-dependent hydrolase